jgi:hypothetical protein
MKPTHRYDTKAYHDYYIQQAGKGYPVFAGRRYQRGHGSIFGGLFEAAMPWQVLLELVVLGVLPCP